MDRISLPSFLNTGFSDTAFLVLFKPSVVIFLSIYCLFAFVIYRQVKTLTTILGTALSPIIKILSVSHFIASLLLFVLALFLL